MLDNYNVLSYDIEHYEGVVGGSPDLLQVNNNDTSVSGLYEMTRHVGSCPCLRFFYAPTQKIIEGKDQLEVVLRGHRKGP